MTTIQVTVDERYSNNVFFMKFVHNKYVEHRQREDINNNILHW